MTKTQRTAKLAHQGLRLAAPPTHAFKDGQSRHTERQSLRQQLLELLWEIETEEKEQAE